MALFGVIWYNKKEVEIMKKLLAFLLLVLTVFSFCSCGIIPGYNIIPFYEDDSDNNDDKFDFDFDFDFDSDDYNKLDEIHVDYEESSYTPITLTNGYDNLENNAQKVMYKDIYKSVYSINDKKTLDGYFYLMEDVVYSGNDEITERDMVIAYAAFKNDNPQCFWIDTVCNPDCSELYDECMYIYSYYSPDETEEKIEDFEEAVEDFLETVPKDLSQVELELYVHDYLYELCQYDEISAMMDYEDKGYEETYDSSNAYGVMVNGWAICQGYAEAYSYLLSLVGIDSTTISSQDHIWNAVKIDGDWYNVDLTWNDTTESYDYFNITNKELLFDHEIAPHYSEMSDKEIVGTDEKAGLWFNVYLPECTATKYCYKSKYIY